ncbi:MAG: hypothetical protein FWE98_06185 [Oscillospiraceae bacterium]|nr:hypothetical protein [Oscillospiraceae bacterium]
MRTIRDDEKWIDDIRAKLYQEMQELGKEEYDRRKREQFLQIAKQYNFKIVPAQDVRRPPLP